MAAIDIADDDSTKACQLKVIRRPIFDEDSDEEESIDEEEMSMYTEEYTLCTLKPGVIYQQTLDVTFSEGEMIYFASTGDCDIHITGNYMTPVDEVPEGFDSDSEDDEDDLDSEDDEDDEDISESDLVTLEAEEDSEEEEDVLDEIDARISALEEAENTSKKSKKRRVSAGDEDLDAVMDDAAAEEPKKLSKKDRKKLKAANGEAVAAPAAVSEDSEDSAKKSVSFSNDTKPAAKLVAGGLAIEDRKTGEGPSVKSGAKVAIRYVGKLKSNGKQFDANSKGKPFTFTVGKGEVIKGMEVGIIGMKAGGERRITVPAAMAYGKKGLPGIPANSDLVFDLKLLKF
ncbi:hypothetical protein BCR37DRAFT_376513 [Protomyces lactucae-debilis]|uniref:peptidylprolyl isomerase n=1 Tax=Protomyces lactucae-debilis TaxID=2754530 RepID=A0A1Y2FU73_PROLT|nr:uncharacterized protein BCR37DRAFT_376513 [Protomyces lactucae-debilis]ORY87117.1 hypothetical protein BCR37DRAFT_376513 [Protomyces lactucae-debilis]